MKELFVRTCEVKKRSRRFFRLTVHSGWLAKLSLPIGCSLPPELFRDLHPQFDEPKTFLDAGGGGGDGVCSIMESQSNRPHHASKEKKKPKRGEKNDKAFAVANPGRLARQAVRSSDIKERRLHVPQVDRVPEEAPPIVVAVVGPPGVGKTTLIKSLIRRYTKQTLSHPTGPLLSLPRRNDALPS